MLTHEEARRIILERVRTLDAERVGLLESRGRVLAVDVAAPWGLPSFTNSAMDGYAVRAEDCRDGVALAIIDYVPAGGRATHGVTEYRSATGGLRSGGNAGISRRLRIVF